MNRVFFFDIDGTIYRDTVGVTQNTVKAFERLRRQGDYVVFSTGRTTPSIEPEFPNVPYDGYVGGNGTQVVFCGRIILNIAMDDGLLNRIVACLRRDGREFVMEGDWDLYSDSYDCNCSTFDYSFYKEKLGDRLKPTDARDRHVNKMAVLIGKRPLELEKYREILDEVTYVLHEDVWELGPKSCSKASGASVLLKHLGVSPQECYAFGDSKNDLEILEYVGHAIAMGDACEEVKRRACLVTDTVERDGVQKALDRLGVWECPG
ncbi:MAG: HAD family hydrolase [Ruminococcus sp.]|nr:HAD family hydrolase [Ruminococcus sp.]